MIERKTRLKKRVFFYFYRIRKHKLRVEIVQLYEPSPTAISLLPAEPKSDSFSEASISYGAKRARSVFLECPAAAPNLSVVSLLLLKPKSGFLARSSEVQDVQVQTLRQDVAFLVC
jgi:hypothetical protein